MPEFDDQVISRSATNLVAFSGGPDSVCLLHLLLGLRECGPLRTVHIDHAMDHRSKERARRARRIAQELGVDCDIMRVTPDRRSGDGGPEAAARHARYACLQSMLDPGDHVLTAHHADDQVETVVLRLLRGAGPRGLAGMRPLRRLPPGWLGRPLLSWSRCDILDYLDRHQLEYQHDPGNRDLSLDRNFIRHELLPKVARRWPAYRTSLLQSARWQQTAAQALERDAAANLEAFSRLRGQSCEQWSGHRPDQSGERLLDLNAWLTLKPEPAFAVIDAWCKTAGVAAPSLRPLQAFRHQCRTAADDRQPKLDWSAACIHAWRGWLWLDIKPQPPTDWALSWPAGDCCPLPVGGELCWSGDDRRTLGRKWEISATRPGLKLRLHANGPRRRITELMRAAGMPPWRRSRFPALYIDGKLCAIGTDWLDTEFETMMAAHGASLTWQRRPTSLLP